MSRRFAGAAAAFVAAAGTAAAWAQPEDIGPLRTWGGTAPTLQDGLLPKGYFRDISVGFQHSIALRTDGSIVVWGADICGSVNNAPPGNDFVAVAAGYMHSLALRADGTVVQWGLWTEPDPSGLPCGKVDCGLVVEVPGGPFVAIDAGESFSAGILWDGTLVVWGYDYCFNPTFYDFSGTYDALSASGHFLLARATDGTMRGWGPDPINGDPCATCTSCNYQQEQADTSLIPSGFYPVASFAAGHAHSLLLNADGELFGWGNNAFGQAGSPPVPNCGLECSSPSGGWTCHPLEYRGPFRQVSGGYWHSVGLKPDGTLVAWGRNVEGSDQVLSVPTGEAFVSISARYEHGLGISACYADCDPDGVLDVFDFLCFQERFLAGDPGVDCDGDGRLTFLDFICFQSEFLAGCR